MSYALVTSARSSNFYPASTVPAHYGEPRTIRGITIHWWGDPSTRPTFEATVAYLCRSGGNTSAHYVVEDGRVARIIGDADAAWHAGSAQGNAETIGVECNPRQSDGDYATVAALIADLRGHYGDLPLYPHRHWFRTACPGTYDLARLDQLARGAATATPPTPIVPLTPTVQEDDMLSLILWCYRELVGREPSVDEIASWLETSSGLTSARVLDNFLASEVEPGGVAKAFRDYLGHDPNPDQIAEWDRPGVTIRAVRDGIKGSPEALARKA